MEANENILDTILEDENLEDVDMLDAETIEEGEIEEQNQCIESTEAADRDNDVPSQEFGNKNRRRRAKKKKRKKSGSVVNVTDINRFVIDTCRQLKERKSYLIWNAVGCLGVSAVRDLIKEKQFRQHNVSRGSDENKKMLPSQKIVQAPCDQIESQASDCPQLTSQTLNDREQHNTDEKRISVLNRIRVPVAYDDLLGEDAKDESS